MRSFTQFLKVYSIHSTRWASFSMGRHPVPRQPLLRFSALSNEQRACAIRAFAQRPGRPVSSGRAAIFQALRLCGVGAGDLVAVPTYHCPTVVAPVVALGAVPAFYPIKYPGLPNLDEIRSAGRQRMRAIIVPQLFGFPLDLSEVRAWCDESGVPMIEDCAHSLFGRAGDRLSGEWGDYATASLSKFLPVAELGWISSSARPVPRIDLRRCALRTEIKGFLDPIQIAAEHGRLGPMGAAIREIVRWRQSATRSGDAPIADAAARVSERQAMQACDMARVERAPSWASRLIARLSDLDEIAAARRRNLLRIADLFRGAGIGRVLHGDVPRESGPYVLPVLVDDHQRLYPEMRRIGFPVYRWDRLWPGTPTIDGDLAKQWWYRLFQIPVHQSYTDEDFERMAAMLEGLSHD